MSDNANVTALIVPGYGGSGPEHWQSLWENMHPSFIRVVQRDWDNPVCNEWVEVLEKAAAEAGEEIVLISHSLGCLLVAHWAAQTRLKIRGALLVAPPDPLSVEFPEQIRGFSPIPEIIFPFSSTVIASTDDPYGSLEFATFYASVWGSRLVTIGAAGHINSDSALGEWQEGYAIFKELAG